MCFILPKYVVLYDLSHTLCCANKQVDKMRDVIKEIEQTYATARQLEELRKRVDGKADSSTFDKVTGGNSKALEDVESKMKQLEQLYTEQAAAVKAAQDTLSNKANAVDVSSLSSAVKEQQASSVPYASITKLQETLDSALAQIQGQKQQLERIQVRCPTTASMLMLPCTATNHQHTQPDELHSPYKQKALSREGAGRSSSILSELDKYSPSYPSCYLFTP
jgi:regulator of replication initiation timing